MEPQFIDENTLLETCENENENDRYEVGESGNQDTELKDSDTLLVELVAQYPLIYNKELKDYKNNSMRENCWLQISVILNKPVSECSKRWQQLRDSYTREKKKRELEARSGCGTSKRKGFPLYETMAFLKQHIQRRKIYTNAAPTITSVSHIRSPLLPTNVQQNCDTQRYIMRPLHTHVGIRNLSSATTSVEPHKTLMRPPHVLNSLQCSQPSTPISRFPTSTIHRSLPESASTFTHQSQGSQHMTYTDTRFPCSASYMEVTSDLFSASENRIRVESNDLHTSPIPCASTLSVSLPTPSPNASMLSPSASTLSPSTVSQSPSTSILSPDAVITPPITPDIVTPPSQPEMSHQFKPSSSVVASVSSHMFDTNETLDCVNASNTTVLPRIKDSQIHRNLSMTRTSLGQTVSHSSTEKLYDQETVPLSRRLPQPKACFSNSKTKTKQPDLLEASFLGLSAVLQNHFQNSVEKVKETPIKSSEQAFANLIATELEKLTESDRLSKKARILQIIYE